MKILNAGESTNTAKRSPRNSDSSRPVKASGPIICASTDALGVGSGISATNGERTMIHNVHPNLESLLQPIDQLSLLPGNPRIGNVDAVARSYERFGQRKPIIARSDGTVIAGNHQLLAADRLGWTHVAVLVVDETDEEAMAFALADNRTSDLGYYDDSLLAAIVRDITDESLLRAASFDADEVMRLASANLEVNLEADSMEEHMKGYKDRDERTIQLSYHLNDFVRVVDLLSDVIDTYSLENNTDAVMKVLEMWSDANLQNK